MAESKLLEIVVEALDKPKEKPDINNLGFGRTFTDRMLICEWENGSWDVPRITSYSNLSLSPASLVFHYGQSIFEGMKAYYQDDGSVKLFRPFQNAKRFNESARRMVMPEIEPVLFVEWIKKLVDLEKEWVPQKEGSSLYIRPTMIASEAILGVKPSKKYLFFIILSPSGPYFSGGFEPTKILVEENYIRAANGGTGLVKASSNYAGSMLATKIAKNQGYDQVLWLDAKNHEFVEEVGAMNIGFVINGAVHSPAPRGTILDGITRKSVKELCQMLNIEFVEKPISINRVIEAIDNKELTEIFGMGTAAVISPVGMLGYKDAKYVINNNQAGPVAKLLYSTLTAIQGGVKPDYFDWMVSI